MLSERNDRPDYRGFMISVKSVDEFTMLAARGAEVVFTAIAALKQELLKKVGTPGFEFLGDSVKLEMTFDYLEQLATTLSFMHSIPQEASGLTLSDAVASWAKGHDPNSGVTGFIGFLHSFNDAQVPGVNFCNELFGKYARLWVPAVRQNALKKQAVSVTIESRDNINATLGKKKRKK